MLMILPGLPFRVRSRPSCGRNACSAAHSKLSVLMQTPCRHSNMQAGAFRVQFKLGAYSEPSTQRGRFSS